MGYRAAQERFMPLSHIEHYLVAADDMESTRDWYCQVLGMQEGWHPQFGFPVYWLYLDGKDVVHIAQNAARAGDSQRVYLGRPSQDSGVGTGALDHIAFRATGLDEMKRHLRGQGVAFDERRANGQALYQLFLYDPNGIKVELNFDAAEAEGRDLEITAEKLARRV
jgi:catechol 2,3-dioxygenase-like lactoylglutathione lyase family enzyme